MDSKRLTVLVVDDDQNTLHTVDFILRSAAYNVTLASNAREALTQMEEASAMGEPVDLIVTDIEMPVMNGLFLIDEIQRRGETLPILPVTAYGDARILAELKRRGCSRYLEKPFEAERLVAEITRLLHTEHQPTP